MARRVVRALRSEMDALRRQHSQHEKADDAHHDERPSPAERGAQTEADDRRQRVAEIAADAVHRIGVAEPLGVDVRVQDREIGRMEDAVANPHDRRGGKQPGRARGERCTERSRDQQRHARQQHRTRAEAIDRKSRSELRHAARGIKGSDECAQKRERDVEFGPQQRKKRRQRELEEMRQAVRDADEHDDAGVATERVGAGSIQNRRDV